MNTSKDPWRALILADAEALADTDLEVIKYVVADHDVATCVSKNWKYSTQYYFGWLRKSSSHVLTLREQLETHFSWRLASKRFIRHA
jgi:hypothetical protein